MEEEKGKDWLQGTELGGAGESFFSAQVSGPSGRPEKSCGPVGSRTRLFVDELLFAGRAALYPKSFSGLGARPVVAARPNERGPLGAQADDQLLDLNGCVRAIEEPQTLCRLSQRPV